MGEEREMSVEPLWINQVLKYSHRLGDQNVCHDVTQAPCVDSKAASWGGG